MLCEISISQLWKGLIQHSGLILMAFYQGRQGCWGVLYKYTRHPLSNLLKIPVVFLLPSFPFVFALIPAAPASCLSMSCLTSWHGCWTFPNKVVILCCQDFQFFFRIVIIIIIKWCILLLLLLVIVFIIIIITVTIM